MRIIKPSASLMKHNVHPYEFIERVGRTCYKSEDSITEGSAERFVANLVKREHMAMLEHETIYLVTTDSFMEEFLTEMGRVGEQLSFFNITHKVSYGVLSGSFRSFYDLFVRCLPTYTLEFIKRGLKFAYPLVFDKFKDAHFFKDFPDGSCVLYTRQEFIYEFANRPEVLFKHLTHTFKFVCDRGVTHEFVRHRVASFAQESTRYCNYTKDKFGREITVIDPCFWSTGNFDEEERLKRRFQVWYHSCLQAESNYFDLVDMGATPQEARTVLPHSLKTELIVTATESEWQHIVNLRYLGTTGAPHPQIKEVMGLALADIIIQSKGRITADKGAK